MDEIKIKITQLLYSLGFTEQKKIISNEEFAEIFRVIDSLNLINFVVGLENTFGIEMPDEFLLPENFNSVDDLSEYIALMLLIEPE
ncbi:MAG: acyl carrier protein [Eubacteriales bacterium]